MEVVRKNIYTRNKKKRTLTNQSSRNAACCMAMSSGESGGPEQLLYVPRRALQLLPSALPPLCNSHFYRPPGEVVVVGGRAYHRSTLSRPSKKLLAKLFFQTEEGDGSLKKRKIGKFNFSCGTIDLE